MKKNNYQSCGEYAFGNFLTKDQYDLLMSAADESEEVQRFVVRYLVGQGDKVKYDLHGFIIGLELKTEELPEVDSQWEDLLEKCYHDHFDVVMYQDLLEHRFSDRDTKVKVLTNIIDTFFKKEMLDYGAWLPAMVNWLYDHDYDWR